MEENNSFLKKTSVIILLVLIFAGIFSIALAEGKSGYWHKAMPVDISVCSVGIAEEKSNSTSLIIVKDTVVEVETISVSVAGDRPIKINFKAYCCNPLDIVIINEQGKICRYPLTISCDSCSKGGTITIEENCYIVFLSPGEDIGYGKNNLELMQFITSRPLITERKTQEEIVKIIIDGLSGFDSVGAAQVIISSGTPRARDVEIRGKNNVIQVIAGTDLPAGTKLLWSFSGPFRNRHTQIDISDERTVVGQDKKIKLRINSGGLPEGKYFLTVKTLAVEGERINILDEEITVPLKKKEAPIPTPTLMPTPAPTLAPTPEPAPAPTRTPAIQTIKILTPIPAPTPVPKTSIHLLDIVIAFAAVIRLSLRKKTKVFS